MDYKDQLYSMIYNQFRNNIINTSYINMTEEEFYDKLLNNNYIKDEAFYSFILLRKYLSETQFVKTYDEIVDIVNIKDRDLRIKYNGLFKDERLASILNKEIKEKILKEDENYKYFNSNNVYGKNDKIDTIDKIDYILTIKQENNDLLAVNLLDKFYEYNIPFQFQLSKNSNEIVLKVDNKHLDIYLCIFDDLLIKTYMIEKLEQEKKDNNIFQFIKSKFRK